MNGWTAEELANLLCGKWHRAPDSSWRADHFSINKSCMTPHSVFISIDRATWLAGTKNTGLYTEWTDGHEVLKGLENPVHGAIVQRFLPELPTVIPQLVVGNSYDVIKHLALHARANMNGTICAITGTAGKSTTKELLSLMLSQSGTVITTNGNHNSRTGVALALANCMVDPDFCVLEVAAAALWMRNGGVSTWVRPDLCIITSVGHSQMDHINSLREMALIKARVCNGIRPGGKVLLYREMAEFDAVRRAVQAYGATPVTYGWTDHCDAYVLDYQYVDQKTMITASVLGDVITYTVAAYGRPVVTNSLAAVTAVKLLGQDLKTLSKVLAEYRGRRGMLEPVPITGPGGTVTLLDDSYNAEILSVKASFEAFRELCEREPQQTGKRIVILGEVVNLAEHAKRLYESLADPLIASSVDMVYCVGANMQALLSKLPGKMAIGCYQDARSCVDAVMQCLGNNDFVLIKGSRRGKDFGKVRGLLEHKIKERYVNEKE